MTADELVNLFTDYLRMMDDEATNSLDFLEQVSILLFLKLEDEYRRLTGIRTIPERLDWVSLNSLDGPDLETHYAHVLETLGRQTDATGAMFQKSSNSIRQPSLLRDVIVNLIEAQYWSSMDNAVRGDFFERLLVTAIYRGDSRAGRHYTFRPLVDALVDIMQPRPGDAFCDPACGTGGFMIWAYQYILEHNSILDPDQRQHLRDFAIQGSEIAAKYRRICVVNAMLHGIGNPSRPPRVLLEDSLGSHPGTTYSLVMSNPEFGQKASRPTGISDGGEETAVYRDDFWQTTTNKQLNFVQHIKTILAINGRAAVVLPDNVLFEGGPGEVIRRNLLTECDVHTILRLPTGISFNPGVKANVVFFDRKAASETPWTQDVWYYDLRTNKHFTLKQRPMTRQDLDDFVACYQAADRSKRVESERFKKFTYDEIMAREKVNLDITWLKEDSETDASLLSDPDVLIAEIVEELMAAANELSEATAPILASDEAEMKEGLKS